MVELQQGDIIHLVIPGTNNIAENKEIAGQIQAFYASYGIHANMITVVPTATTATVVSVIRGYKGNFSSPKSF